MRHQPYNKFKGAIREKGLSYTDIANLLEISTTAVAHKVNGHTDFYVSEISKITRQYGIPYYIFLNN